MTPAENAQASASNTAVAATMASNHTLILVLLYVEEAAVLFCFFPLLGSSTEKGITCAKRLAAMQCTPFLVSSFLQIKYVGQLLGFVFSLSLSLSHTHTHMHLKCFARGNLPHFKACSLFHREREEEVPLLTKPKALSMPYRS
jgi:hypothetical protein